MVILTVKDERRVSGMDGPTAGNRNGAFLGRFGFLQPMQRHRSPRSCSLRGGLVALRRAKPWWIGC